MAEYIERDALMKYPIRIDHCDMEHGKLDFVLGIESVLEYAEYLPAADVVEVKHARWVKTSEFMPIYGCSECGERNLFKNGDNVFSAYCPNCGARMDGEGDA